MGTYLRSEAGRDPLLIAIVSLVALVLAIGAARSDRRVLPWGAAAAAAIVLGLRAHGGHAASAPAPVIAELTQWVHMLAGACWAGGLVLLLLLLRERRDPPVAEARRYSAMAIVAIAVVVASGLVRAFTELGGWSGLSSTLSTGYGQTLAVKIAVVIAVIALGAWNRYRGIGRLDNDARPLRRVVTAEIVGVAGILALTATLTGLAPPASSAEASGDAQAVTVQGSDFATTVTAEMTITPGLPGQNAFRATVSAYGTDQPYAADAVVLQLRSVTRAGPASGECRPDGRGRRGVGRPGALALGGRHVRGIARGPVRNAGRRGAARRDDPLDRHGRDGARPRRGDDRLGLVPRRRPRRRVDVTGIADAAPPDRVRAERRGTADPVGLGDGYTRRRTTPAAADAAVQYGSLRRERHTRGRRVDLRRGDGREERHPVPGDVARLGSVNQPQTSSSIG